MKLWPAKHILGSRRSFFYLYYSRFVRAFTTTFLPSIIVHNPRLLRVSVSVSVSVRDVATVCLDFPEPRRPGEARTQVCPAAPVATAPRPTCRDGW